MPEIFFRDLGEKVQKHISCSEKHVDIFSPFITLDVLEHSIRGIQQGVRVSVITRWKLIDFLLGSASLELFDFCSSKGFVLYINSRLHLKTVVNDYQSLLLGSSNITGRGLGLLQPENYEVLSYISNPSSNFLLFLEHIKAESSLVTESIVARFQRELDRLELKLFPNLARLDVQDDELHAAAKNRDFFLTSELPMCADIKQLYRIVQNPDLDLDKETLLTSRHDIIKYGLLLRSYESEKEFREYLAHQFLSHPFIQALCNFIDRPRRFGEVRAWAQQVCTDVPVPTRRSLSDNVNVLYDWLVILGEKQFVTYRPNHTEFIAPRY